MKRFFLCIFWGFSVLYGEQAKVGVVHIDDAITSATYTYVHYALCHFEKEGVDSIIVHLDTPGGEVFSSIKIANRLKQTLIPVVAYIENWAVSAGAMIAYACPKIYVHESAIMGAAEPIMESADGSMVTASEKVNSALRAQFSVLAKGHNRNALIAQAMVDKELIVVSRQGTVISVATEGDILPEDVVITRKDKLLTLDAEELVHWGVADAYFTESFFEDPTLQQSELMEFSSWRMGLFSVLTHPAVTSILSIGILAGLYMEYAHPSGLGICLSAFCLGMTLLTQYSLEMFYALEAVMLILGVALIVIEIFVFPGHFIFGLLGLGLLVGALCVTGMPQVGDVTLPSFVIVQTLTERLLWFTSVLAITIVLCCIFGRKILDTLLRKSPLVLYDTEDQNGKCAMVAETLEGATGITCCPCRPSGKVQVANKQYDALSKGQYIPKGNRIKVVTIQGSTLVIEEDI